ncbi:MAG: hypothetical protein KBS84_02705 [Treponema sp.]|nr:hypothetical protein [Candidatus Treponema scatequi]
MFNNLNFNFGSQIQNLIISGIPEFTEVFEYCFNYGSENCGEMYKNHFSAYEELEKNKNFMKSIKILEYVEQYKTSIVLKGNTEKLTAAIHLMTEEIAKRKFSLKAEEYTVNDFRELQSALGLLWMAGETPGRNSTFIEM